VVLAVTSLRFSVRSVLVFAMFWISSVTLPYCCAVTARNSFVLVVSVLRLPIDSEIFLLSYQQGVERSHSQLHLQLGMQLL
jgi:uncharacterized SAM-binding protein YcdF (DUF218 family)